MSGTYKSTSLRIVHGLVVDENGQRKCPYCHTLCPENGGASISSRDLQWPHSAQFFTRSPEKYVARFNKREVPLTKYSYIYITCVDEFAHSVLNQ